ncbi:hypothetical protein SAY87_013536 [Trapa incisa]|uniref:Uncharacterized protein n=1 Tax=Trapa incisa TaxID=236973 RepID=A0AAN7K8V6_9MYRT|nr:hypothetical protein SAY87_013536 [Trapa incisa]
MGEYYACGVDLLGQSGLLKEAGDLIKANAMEPDLFVQLRHPFQLILPKEECTQRISPLVNESKGRINTSSSCPTVGVSSYQIHPNGDATSQTKDVMNLTFIHMPPQRSCPFSTRLDFFEGSSSTVKSSICGPLSH